MPEGPEVRTLVHHLNRYLQRKQPTTYQITQATLFSGRYYNTGSLPEGWDLFLAKLPLNIHRVAGKGKFIYFELDQGISLWSTLGMSGGWTLNDYHRHKRFSFTIEAAPPPRESAASAPASTPAPAPTDEPLAEQLTFIDSRNFGTLKVCFDANELTQRLNKLGPSWLHGQVTLDVFRALLLKPGKPQRNRLLAVFLMDQTKTSGIGNYILAEGLYVAELYPWMKVGELKEEDIDRLYYGLLDIILRSCRSQVDIARARFDGGSGKCGRTEEFKSSGGGGGLDLSFLGQEGQESSMEDGMQTRGGCGSHFKLRVYGQKRDANGYAVVRDMNGPHKRTIWWVPEVQRERIVE